MLRSGELPHVLIDTTYWKSFVQAQLATTPGDRGALTLYGTNRTNYALFTEHVAGAETSALNHDHQTHSAHLRSPDLLFSSEGASWQTRFPTQRLETNTGMTE